MKLSFSLPSKSQSNRSRKLSQSFSAADAGPSAADSTDKNYVTEFDSAESLVDPQSKPKIIPPIPNQWRPNKKLKNLPNLPSLKSDGENTLQFEVVSDGNPDSSDKSMAFGLNLRSKPSGVNGGSADDPGEELNLPISDLELRKLREDLDKLPEDAGVDEYTDMPVEGFGAALLSGYGWNKDRGIGRNAKEDTKILEVKKRAGRGGLGYEGELPDNQNGNDSNAGEAFGSRDVRRNKGEDAKEKKGLDVGEEVRMVKGSEMGMKGKIIEVRSGGDLLVLRMSRSGEKVKVRVKDVVEVGSAEEEKCLRKLKELKVKEKNSSKDKSDKTSSSKRGREEGRIGSERVNWLRNHIRVRIVSEVLKGGRLYLKKGVVMDVVGPGVCDISMDESGELVQGVDQDLLETAIPKRGGKVLVLYGRHKGVYGSLLERDLEKETGLVQDADTQEFVNVRLEQIAEYIGDPSHIGY
ncbi:MOS2 [Olea europaea subsp. europaea]|uniref:MOS2 n=1 Tax=Olea europaea subsp. europaea TaxID=158383 RepID=A0A8S0UD48_OLEEU|nr:MOS2 [Olea europaea subsp. europaea]